MSSDLLTFKVGKETLRIRLLTKENPELVVKVLQQVDEKGQFESPLGHVVISGDGIWVPTKILYLGKGKMVPRTPGTVYFYAPGKTICITYGSKITESANVNKFGEVFPDDLSKLEQLGKQVYDKTVQSGQRDLVLMTMRKSGTAFLQLPPAQAIEIPVFKEHWKETVAVINAEVDNIWTVKPNDIKKIELGISNTGAGTGDQMFFVQVHLKAYTMMTGADIVYRFLQSAGDEDMTLPLLKRMTTSFLFKPFSIPEFMTDLGLEKMHEIGDMYVKALETVESFEDYILLTDALLNYINRYHRWVHHIFPWHLGTAFPHRKPDDIRVMANILSVGAPMRSEGPVKPALMPDAYRY